MRMLLSKINRAFFVSLVVCYVASCIFNICVAYPYDGSATETFYSCRRCTALTRRCLSVILTTTQPLIFSVAGLLSLSHERLILIYSSSTIQSTVSLSSANTQLHSILLANNNQILESILRKEIPTYEDVVDFATLEETWTNNTRLALSSFNRIVLCL
jgi:hypothetical protein